MNFSKANAAFGLDDRQSAVMAAVSAAVLAANLGNILRFLLPRVGTLDFFAFITPPGWVWIGSMIGGR